MGGGSITRTKLGLLIIPSLQKKTGRSAAQGRQQNKNGVTLGEYKPLEILSTAMQRLICAQKISSRVFVMGCPSRSPHARRRGRTRITENQEQRPARINRAYSSAVVPESLTSGSEDGGGGRAGIYPLSSSSGGARRRRARADAVAGRPPGADGQVGGRIVVIVSPIKNDVM